MRKNTTNTTNTNKKQWVKLTRKSSSKTHALILDGVSVMSVTPLKRAKGSRVETATNTWDVWETTDEVYKLLKRV